MKITLKNAKLKYQKITALLVATWVSGFFKTDLSEQAGDGTWNRAKFTIPEGATKLKIKLHCDSTSVAVGLYDASNTLVFQIPRSTDVETEISLADYPTATQAILGNHTTKCTDPYAMVY